MYAKPHRTDRRALFDKVCAQDPNSEEVVGVPGALAEPSVVHQVLEGDDALEELKEDAVGKLVHGELRVFDAALAVLVILCHQVTMDRPLGLMVPCAGLVQKTADLL